MRTVRIFSSENNNPQEDKLTTNPGLQFYSHLHNDRTDKGSGKKIEFHGFVLWRFENRKIVERWATITPANPS
jgi:hypothetical protein